MDRAEAVIEESLTCSFCLELFRVPKTLQCGHNFCGKCLQQYVNKQNKTERQLQGIKCPQCREETPVPDPSKPITDWVKQFRTNCAIQNVIEGIIDHVRKDCGICESEGIEVQSDHFCRTCKLGLCSPCHDVHKRIPVCSNHDVQQTVKTLPPKYKGLDFKVHLDTSSDTRQRKRFQQRVKAEVQKRIENICQKALNSLKEKQAHLTDQANAAVDETFERFNAGYPPADSSGDDSSSDADSVDGHHLLASIRLTSRVESFINNRYDVSLAQIHTAEDFKDEEITDVKQISNTMESFSDENKVIETEEIHLTVGDDDGSSSESSNENDNLEDNLEPILTATIDTVTDQDDNDPWIRNILVMNSCDIETIIVTDFNNSSVKAFYKEDEDFAGPTEYEVSRLVVRSRPWGVAELPNERIVVTCPEKKLITKIRVNPALQKLSDISVPKEFYGLAAVNSSTLVASAPKERPPGIYILDESGRILKTIVKDRTRRNMFEAPFYIQLAAWGDILVAEEKARKILSVTKDGLLRSQGPAGECLPEKLPSLFGFTSSKMGSVYLADQESNKIVVVREGKDYKVFLSEKDTLSFPRCVCLYNQDSMFVGEEGGTVKKFKLLAH